MSVLMDERTKPHCRFVALFSFTNPLARNLGCVHVISIRINDPRSLRSAGECTKATKEFTLVKDSLVPLNDT